MKSNLLMPNKYAPKRMVNQVKVLTSPSEYQATFKISFNFQNMVQPFEIYHATHEGCISGGNMYNNFRRFMGVMHF